MISITLIKWLFYISLVVVTITGIVMMSRESFIIGLLVILLGVLLVRVYCKAMIVLFKIHESLVELKNK